MRKQYKKLTYADRQTIERMSGQGIAPKAIALETGVHIATIYREIQRGTDAEGHYKGLLLFLPIPFLKTIASLNSQPFQPRRIGAN